MEFLGLKIELRRGVFRRLDFLNRCGIMILIDEDKI